MTSPSKARGVRPYKSPPSWGAGDINWTALDGARVREPIQAYPDDAGFDLFVSEDRTIQPGQVIDIPCGVAFEIPSSMWVLLIGRSSTLRKRYLMVNPGIIDPGYRGELFAGVMNMSDAPVLVNVGERLAQAIFLPNLSFGVRLNQVDSLAPHDRGSNGFGSSGT